MTQGMAYAEKKLETGSSKHGATIDSDAITMYIGFFAICALVFQCCTVGLSTLPTLSIALQALALVFLRMKVAKTKNVRGISVKSLTMQSFVHGLRLCSTTWLKGYIPADETGDFLYQFLDVVVLVVCLQLIYTCLRTHRDTYQADEDNLEVMPMLLFCFVIGVLIHPDLNDRVLFDTIWATALYIDVIAMIPQLWMMSKVGQAVEALTGHYVALIALSRLMSCIFWYFGFVELAPVDGGANIAGWCVIGAHVLQQLILGDFMFYYFKACVKSCCEFGSCSNMAPIKIVDVEI